MKRILISGVSGSGKTTLLSKLDDKYEKFYEIGGNPSVKFWYDLATSGEATNHFAKNIMLANRVYFTYENMLKASRDNVSDRGLIDILVASELRIKDKNPQFHNELSQVIDSLIKDLIDKKKIYTECILFKLTWEEFQERIFLRNRPDEARNLKNNDSWYREYFDAYNEVTKKYLNKYNIPFKEVTPQESKDILKYLI